jgi:hypothetical protein
MYKITKTQAQKVLSVVDKGLSGGLGKRVPGMMCVEAAVCFAFGEEHGDEPTCVHHDLRDIKIGLNDFRGWKNKKDRARGMRRLAIAQLGSVSNFNSKKFWDDVNALLFPYIKKRFIASFSKIKNQKEAEKMLMNETKHFNFVFLVDDLLGAERVANYIMPKTSKSKQLHFIAEVYTQALIKQKIPGTKFLYLTKNKPHPTV